MKIPKKYKKQAKQQIKNSACSVEIKKPKMIWSAKKGDLVSIDDSTYGIVLKADQNQFLVLSSAGTRWWPGKKVLKVQNLSTYPDTCK